MADNIYQVGEKAPLEATFKNAAGVGTNPTTVVLEVRAPDGTVTTPSATALGAGVYHYDQDVTQPGLWWYSFQGTGAVNATEQKSFYAEARYTATGAYPIPTDALVTLDEARNFVLNNPADSGSDRQLIKDIKAISQVVKMYTNRQWLPLETAVTHKFNYPGYGMLRLSPYDLRTVTNITVYSNLPTAYQTVLVAGGPSTLGDYELLPIGGTAPAGTYRWLIFTPGPFGTMDWYWYDGWQEERACEVSITGNWGIGVVPEDVKLAVLIAIKDSVENPTGSASRQMGPLSVSPEPEDFDFAGARWRALPAESRALLSPYTIDEGIKVA